MTDVAAPNERDPEIHEAFLSLACAILGFSDPLEVKVARDKPADAVDACFVNDNEVTDPSTCRTLYPYYGDARIVAGGPFTDDILKCQLRALDRSVYNVAFTDAQWALLQQAFPTGVCDWSKPGVDQQPMAGMWQSLAAAPANTATR